jgi:hypothetical protein
MEVTMAFSPEFLWGVGTVALLFALIWGVRQSRSRNPQNDAVAEAATREAYRRPENYEHTRKEFKRQVTPS